MSGDRRSTRRVGLFDTDEPGRIVNEFLVAVFLPGILALVTLWAVFRLYLDDALLSFGLVRMTPDPLPFVAIESGYGRFALLVVLTVLFLVAYLSLYVRVLRPPLKEREIV